jgi:hypothetical protein
MRNDMSRSVAAVLSDRRGVAWFLVFAGTCVLCSLHTLPSAPALRAAEPSTEEDLFVEKLSPDRERLTKQYEADTRRITIRQISLFHYRFLEAIDRCAETVSAQYCGILYWGTAHPKQKVEDNLGDVLGWHVFKDGVGIFSLWISTQRTAETVAKCAIEGQVFFVNVTSVSNNRSVDDRMPELGGHSVREVLANIEKPSGSGLKGNLEPTKKK